MLVSYVHIVLILNAPNSQKSILERTITDCMFNYMFINIISPVSCNLLYEICFVFLFLKILLKLITVTLSAQDARNPTNVLSYLSSQNLTQPSQFLHSLFYSKLRILLYTRKYRASHYHQVAHWCLRQQFVSCEYRRSRATSLDPDFFHVYSC